MGEGRRGLARPRGGAWRLAREGERSADGAGDLSWVVDDGVSEAGGNAREGREGVLFHAEAR